MSVSECALTSSIWSAAGVCRSVFSMAFVCLLLLSQVLWSWHFQIRCIYWNAAGWIFWCWDWCGDLWITPGNSSSHLTSNWTGKTSDIGKRLLPQHKWHCSECFDQNVLQTHLYVGIEGKPQNSMEISTSDFTIQSCFPKRLRVVVQLDGLHHITHITFATHIHSYIDPCSICAVNVKNCLD